MLLFCSVNCCCVQGGSCRQFTSSQENHSNGYNAKGNRFDSKQHQKITSHSKCSCTWSFNCSQKEIFYIWRFFNFSLDYPRKLFALLVIKMCILTNLESMLAHLCLVSICKYCSQYIPVIAAKIKQIKRKSNSEVTEAIRHCTWFHITFFLIIL